ncbi:flagellar biosynthesis protein [Sphingobium indicum]|uniref:Flagellar biosynthesis protein n=2 Tax=Sphingobium indicum TaxID=332055 RepID=A0A1L5BQW0_SPHIB|nr:flagellar biosynthesis protein [Sphingobium indicum]APL95285.1 flagellar biosynthesis protein [Sphingobium indicum B90A]RYM02618.1 flagellar biosynthesis protein [Sphingobium indicum]
MILSKLWTNADVASVPLGGMGQVTSGGFRSRFTPMHAPSGQAMHDSVPETEEDLLEQARMEAFAMGFDEGSRVTAEANATDADARRRLAEALELLTPAPSGMLSTMLSATVVRLVEQIVGEVEIDIERLLQRCDSVAAFIEENDEKGALHLHPDDIELLEGESIGVKLVPDGAMQRGCVRLETADGWVEDGPDVRLSRLRALLDDMEGKA